MKKQILTTMLLSTVLTACTIPCYAFAAETMDVAVTIADADGNLVLTQADVVVTDADRDGVLTIGDALYAAHETYYEGGAESGYAASMTDYGLSLDMLWGNTNGGSHGYYRNHASAMSLLDPIAEGDRITAFSYTDLAGWSDQYCYFDPDAVSATEGEEITLTLLGAGYDEAWNPITAPVADAYIVLDGVRTSYRTDADGVATLPLTAAGTHIISAVSDTAILVPPVCVAAVNGSDTGTSTTAPVTTAATTSADGVDTGDSDLSIWLLAAMTLMGIVAIGCNKRIGCRK